MGAIFAPVAIAAGIASALQSGIKQASIGRIAGGLLMIAGAALGAAFSWSNRRQSD